VDRSSAFGGTLTDGTHDDAFYDAAGHDALRRASSISPQRCVMPMSLSPMRLSCGLTHRGMQTVTRRRLISYAGRVAPQPGKFIPVQHAAKQPEKGDQGLTGVGLYFKMDSLGR
jgi:hypothetical protein